MAVNAHPFGQLLFKDKQIRLLIALSKPEKEWYISELAKEVGVTYVHTSRFLSACELAGIVSSEKHGRLKRIFLTEKGKKTVASISDILALAKKEKVEVEQKEKEEKKVEKEKPA